MSEGAWMMVLATVLALGSLAFLIFSMARSIQVESSSRRSVWREFGLGLSLMALFFITWIAHGIAEWQTFTDTQREHGQPVSAGDFFAEFGQSTLENWQSEFLQLFAFVVLAALFIHKGSAESKDGTEKLEASLRRIEEKLATLPSSAPNESGEEWKLPDSSLEAHDAEAENSDRGPSSGGQAGSDGGNASAPDVLTRDHRKVRGLFEQYHQRGGAAVVTHICNELRMHTAIEEEVLYPVLREVPDGAAMRESAEQEHDEVEALIAQIENLGYDSEEIGPLVERIIDAVSHHVDEEESTMFPRLQDELGEPRLLALGDQLMTAKREHLVATGALVDLTKDELVQLAQAAAIEGRSTMTKDQLIDALQT